MKFASAILFFSMAAGLQAAPPVPVQDNGIHVGRFRILNSESFRRRIQNQQQIIASWNLSLNALSGQIGAVNAGSTLVQNQDTNLSTAGSVPPPAHQLALPETGAPAALSGISPAAASLNPAQLLLQTLNAQYEVINAEFLLARAANEVMQSSEPGKRNTLLIQVPITLSPSLRHQNLVAEVRCDVSMPRAKDPLRVTALMPRERTYNVQRVVSKRSAVSLGLSYVPLSLFSGSSKITSDQVLVQDHDVIAFQVTPPSEPSHHQSLLGGNIEKGGVKEPTSASFMWHFRPVFEDAVVQPGQRDLLVVLSVPSSEIAESLKNLSVAVNTTWRPYSRKERTLLDDKKKIEPVSTHSILALKNLVPTFNKVEVSPVKEDAMLVKIKGTGIYEDLAIIAGGKTIRTDVSGSDVFTFEAPASVIAGSMLECIDALGVRRSISTSTLEKTPSKFEAEIIASNEANTRIRMRLYGKGDFLATAATAFSEACFYRIAGSLVGPRGGISWTKTDDYIERIIEVPTKALAGSPRIEVLAPFLQNSDQTSFAVSAPLQAESLFYIDSVSVVGKTASEVSYVVAGSGLTDSLNLVVLGSSKDADKVTVKPLKDVPVIGPGVPALLSLGGGSSTALLVTVPVSVVSEGRTILISSSICSQIITLPDPKVLAAPKEPDLKPIEVDQFFEGEIALAGGRALHVVSAAVGTKAFTVNLREKVKTIILTLDVTSKPGTKNISFILEHEGKTTFILVPLIVKDTGHSGPRD